MKSNKQEYTIAKRASKISQLVSYQKKENSKIPPTKAPLSETNEILAIVQLPPSRISDLIFSAKRFLREYYLFIRDLTVERINIYEENSPSSRTSDEAASRSGNF